MKLMLLGEGGQGGSTGGGGGSCSCIRSKD